ncbi:MAG: hypothetical protein RSF02_02570 [Bacilli bacterium]
MKLLTDIKEILMALSFVDLIFFFAVLVLMILIVTLIYFIKINDEVLKPSDNLEETQEMKIVKELTNGLESGGVNIDFTKYEKDQEDKAIISYDELLNKGSSYAINYEDEKTYDDLTVKKVNLDDLINYNDEETPKTGIRVISFAKEEAFLLALKQLQKELS